MCRFTWTCDIQLSRLFTDRYWQLLHHSGSAPSPIPFIGLMNDDTHILIEITSKEDWGGNVSLNFYSQENEEDTFVFFLWKTWYEFSFRFHRFQILQWAIAPGTTCLWIKDFEGNHENIHFIACCMKYLIYLSSVSKFNFLWHSGHKRPSTFYQILAKKRFIPNWSEYLPYGPSARWPIESNGTGGPPDPSTFSYLRQQQAFSNTECHRYEMRFMK